MTECPKCKRRFKGYAIGGHMNGECGVTPADLFWQKVDKSAGAGKCWPWTGSRTSWHYGHFNSKTIGEGMAHRIAWELLNGRVTGGRIVMHTCDNPPCCNPEHLILGTWKDNAQDKVRKLRDPSASLKPDQVREIRAALTKPYRGIQTALARQYGVCTSVICNINLGDTYQWVT